MLVPVLLVLALGSWALASPVGASPDDDFHLASAWCGLGEREGLCESDADPLVRVVPTEVATAANCYAFQPEQSAECQTRGVAAAGEMSRTDRGNFAAQYPGPYYSVMGVLASADVHASVIAMRMLNVIIAVGLSTAAWLLLPARRRPILTWSWLVGVVPLGLFIIASNNPSSWAVISAGVLWISLVGYFETRGRRRIGLGVVSAVAALIGVVSRPDAVLFTGIAVVVAIVLTWRRERDYLLAALLPVGIIVVAAVVFLLGNPAAVASGNLGGASIPLSNPLGLLIVNAVNMPELWVGVWGSWNLGWLDTPVPGLVAVGGVMVFAGVVFSGLRESNWRKTVLLLMLVAALWVIPSYVLLQNRAAVGNEVQPRYLLPLILIFAGVALTAARGHSVDLTRMQRAVVASVLSVAASLSLFYTLRRFVVGTDEGSPNLDAIAEWWWSAAPSPLTVWGVGTIAFTIAVFALTMHGRPSNQRHESTDETSGIRPIH